MPQAGLVAAPTDGHLQGAGEQHILTLCQGLLSAPQPLQPSWEGLEVNPKDVG